MMELVVPWATLAVKTATAGCSVVPLVQLVVLELDTGFHVGLMVVQMASLGIDLAVFYLVQLIPEGTPFLLYMVVLSAIVLVGLVLLLLTWKFPLLVLRGLAVLVESAGYQLDSAASG